MESIKDNKTQLQELMQKRGEPLPIYEVTDQSGQQHNLMFTVSCYLPSLDQGFLATGTSRRKAEQAAAAVAIDAVSEARRKP